MATILTKKKDTTGAPLAGDLTNSSGGAELAVNTADKRLYTKDSGGNVVEVGINPTSITTGTLNTSGQVVFNDAGADVDFRVEGDTDANLLFVDASTDRVGIGTNTPAVSGLEISKATGTATPTPVELRLSTTNTASDWSTTDPWGRISFYSADTSAGGAKIVTSIDCLASATSGGNGSLVFKYTPTGTATLTEAMRIDSSGNVGIGTTTLTDQFQVETSLGDTYGIASRNTTHNGTFTAAYSSISAQPIDNGGQLDLSGRWSATTPTSFRTFGRVLGAKENATAENYAGYLALSTRPNGGSLTERMRITSAGEVLVGGTTEIAGVSGLSVQYTNSNPSITLFRNDTSVSTGNSFGEIAFYGNDTTSNTPTKLAYINASASGTHAAGDNPTDLVFGCTNDGSGTVAEFARIGQGSSDSRSFVLQQPTLINGGVSYVEAAGGTAGTNNRYATVGVYKHSGITNACGFLRVYAEDGANNFLWADNSDVLRISTTFANIGTTGGTVVGTQTSDERLKDISGPVSYGLNEVLAIEPIAFTMKDDPSIPKIGFSAQQVQPIVPEAVYDTKECIDGYTENEETKEQIANSDRTKLAMEYTQLIPVLVNAVKELKAELDEAKARIAALEN